MRRIATMLLVLAVVGGCSSSIPRHSAVFIPTAPPTPPPATAASSADTSGWVALAPDGEGFSVLMPGKATASTISAKSPGGDVPTTTWSATSAVGSFDVAHARFPKGSLSVGSPAAVLDAGMKAIAANVLPRSTISNVADVTVGGHAGRTFTFSDSKTASVCEFFVVGDDIYTLFVGSEPGKMDAAVVRGFFASFQLTV
jgi:hypothetical protein